MGTLDRVNKLRQKFAEKGIEAFWITQPDNLYYLSGCEGLEGYLLISQRKAVLVTDFRYIEQAQRQSPGYEIFRISGKMSSWFPDLVASLNIKRLGFESSHLSFTAHQQLTDILAKAGLSIELAPDENLIESLRIIKEPGEIDYIVRAAKITGAVLEYIANAIHPGMSEKLVAWEIEKFMRENGSQPVPFELIVAAGPNSALPHAKPSDTPIHPGEPIVVDIGSKYNYYGSDMTRTFSINKRDETFKKVYDTVLNAQLSAIAGIKSGMTGQEADNIAREIIVKAGYGDSFGHSLGHGIGLVTHENPRIGPNSNDILTDGMVFTVEPGIYISGWGGVRIEDDVVMEHGKLRVISSADK
jgi:Xaa-Pro aminopeptidase